MGEVKFSIKMDEDKKALLEALGKDNYRNLTGEINFAVDFYIKHLKSTGDTFIKMSSSTQTAIIDTYPEPTSIQENLKESSSPKCHPVAPTGTQKNLVAPTGIKLNTGSFTDEVEDI